jgi:hypothetical protein
VCSFPGGAVLLGDASGGIAVFDPYRAEASPSGLRARSAVFTRAHRRRAHTRLIACRRKRCSACKCLRTRSMRCGHSPCSGSSAQVRRALGICSRTLTRHGHTQLHMRAGHARKGTHRFFADAVGGASPNGLSVQRWTAVCCYAIPRLLRSSALCAATNRPIPSHPDARQRRISTYGRFHPPAAHQFTRRALRGGRSWWGQPTAALNDESHAAPPA